MLKSPGKKLTLFQSLYNEAKERAGHMEQVNLLGGRFIREAKVVITCKLFLGFTYFFTF